MIGVVVLSLYQCDFLLAIAEVYKNEGNDEYRKKNFIYAIYLYTEGINVKCKDEELNAKLYNNRVTVHFYLGEKCCFFPQVFKN